MSQTSGPATPGSLVPFQGTQFLARRKVFKLFGAAFHLYGADGSLRAYVKQKAFKLREAITVFTDETMATPLLVIQARSIIDFSAIYDVTTPEGVRVGSLQRKGMKSILRDQWLLMDAQGTTIGQIDEDSMMFALLRRFLSNLIPQAYTFTVNGSQVATFRQRFNLFVHKFDVDYSPDTQGLLDRRLGVAAVVLLLAIEGRQG